MKLRILGHDVAVKYKKFGDNRIGQADSFTDTITMFQGAKSDVHLEGILHEVIHLMIACNALGRFSEAQISTLSNSMYAFIKDNPGYIKRVLDA